MQRLPHVSNISNGLVEEEPVQAVKQEFFSVPEVAIKLGCSARFLWDLIERGRLRSSKIGRRVFVAQGEVDRLMADHLR